jgi:hypothetical protein
MPLDFIPAPQRVPLFRLFFGLTIAFFAVFSFLDQPLRAPAAPSGIVSFQLARTPEAASAMIQSWDEAARLFAAFGLGFDFLFMPVYATALSLAVSIAADRRRGGVWVALGKFLAWVRLPRHRIRHGRERGLVSHPAQWPIFDSPAGGLLVRIHQVCPVALWNGLCADGLAIQAKVVISYRIFDMSRAYARLISKMRPSSRKLLKIEFYKTFTWP